MRNDKKALAGGIALVALLGLTVGAGVYKRQNEKNMPIKYTPEECKTRISECMQLEMREIPFSWGKTYNIVSDGERVGTVYENPFSWGKKFEFYAGTKEKGLLLGHADEQVFSFGHKSTVYDESGRQIGKLDEVVMTINPGHLIEIYGSKGEKIGVSDEKAFSMAHATDIYDSTGEKLIGGTSKSMFWDDYTVSIPKTLDKRLVLALVAMEDKLDDEKDSESKKSSSK